MAEEFEDEELNEESVANAADMVIPQEDTDNETAPYGPVSSGFHATGHLKGTSLCLSPCFV